MALSLGDSVTRGIIDFDLLHQIIHGDANKQVTTENGSVPSIAKVIAAVSSLVTASLSATSVTPQTFSTGNKAFSTQAGKSFQPGQFVVIAASTGFLFGTVVSYNDTSLVVNITQFQGSGTASNWNISFTGPSGIGTGNNTTSSSARLVTKMPWEQ